MESSPLDYVAQASMDLTDALKVADKAARQIILTNHIKKMCQTVAPLEDFPKNLEWANVSEPISLQQHCIDKIVVLDFWTYCCINCLHVLPDLAHIETIFEDHELAVIGVHSAKFLNEKDSSNVLAAVQRYNIRHPVVNDPESIMWESLGIRCWPTLLILAPGNKPVFILTGEGHRDELEQYITAIKKVYALRLSKTPLPVAGANVVPASTNFILKFPSKVSANPFYRGRSDEPFLAISDCGHHRVLLTDATGVVLRIIGGPDPGFKDGKLSEAQFNSPQGLCWLSSNVLVVCDTNNHAIRGIHLDEGNVEVLAGTGQQLEHRDLGGKCLSLQALSSPWDILVYSTPDLDMSVRPLLPVPDKDNNENATENESEKRGSIRRVLLIACAGSHQIWALFLDTTIWWRYKTYPEGTCVCVAGSGVEAARNSAYPHTAAFAQPAALTLRPGTSPELFIADSESSSIRKLALTSGQVTTLCGGDKNPMNLFAYGDVDDIGTKAKLQHPLAVVYSDSNKSLYIADTYNNKIKKVDMSTQKVTSLNIVMVESSDPVKFNEPSGLTLSPEGKYLYVADTNNHSIKIVNIAKNTCQELVVRLPDPKFVEPENLILYKNDLFVNRKCGNLIIYFNVSLDSDSKAVKFTPGAPQNWNLCVRDENNLDVTEEDFDFISCGRKGNKLPGRVEMKLRQRTDKTHYRLYLGFQTALCDPTVCFSHTFTIRSTILVRDSVKLVESYRITCKVNPVHRPTNATKVDDKPRKIENLKIEEKEV